MLNKNKIKNLLIYALICNILITISFFASGIFNFFRSWSRHNYWYKDNFSFFSFWRDRMSFHYINRLIRSIIWIFSALNGIFILLEASNNIKNKNNIYKLQLVIGIISFLPIPFVNSILSLICFRNLDKNSYNNMNPNETNNNNMKKNGINNNNQMNNINQNEIRNSNPTNNNNNPNEINNNNNMNDNKKVLNKNKIEELENEIKKLKDKIDKE